MGQTLAKMLTNTSSLTLILVLGIPIIAIICGSITGIVKMVLKHRERMGLIEHGIHPDYPPDEAETDEPDSPSVS